MWQGGSFKVISTALYGVAGMIASLASQSITELASWLGTHARRGPMSSRQRVIVSLIEEQEAFSMQKGSLLSRIIVDYYQIQKE